MRMSKGDTLVMIGDSITDAGRARPGINPAGGPFGNGYVNMVASHLRAAYPAHLIRVVNQGIGGHTVRDLKDRWQTDVLDLKPDWLSVMIGINDVWRQFDSPTNPQCHVYLDEYRSTLDELVAQTASQVRNIVLMTPYFIEPNKKDPMRVQMDRYSQTVKAIAKKYRTLFVDTQAVFDRVLKIRHPYYISGDRIHPNQTGHLLLAKSFLDAVEFTW